MAAKRGPVMGDLSAGAQWRGPREGGGPSGQVHIGMSLSCEMVLIKKLELEATELNLRNNNQKVHTPALVYKRNGS